MNFWTKEKLIEAYPYCRLHNMPTEWTGSGLRIWHDEFEQDNMALLRFDGEKRGIVPLHRDKIIDKASALVCSKGHASELVSYGKPIIEVDDTSEVIFAYARYIRSYYNGKVIAVTGSAGKSTTTSMVYEILKDKGASSNLNKANTSWGIGWNLTTFDLDNPYWVVETSLGGGMIRNSSLTIPDIAIVTTIAPVHLTGDETLRDVAFRKSKIFSSMSAGKVAIIYNEIPYFDIFEDMILEKKLKLITVGEGENSNIRIDAESSNCFIINGQRYELSGELLPKHILIDMGMAIAAAIECGESVENAIEKLRNFKSLEGRGEVFSGKIDFDKNITLIDESYNANPVSMRASLEGFYRMYGGDDKSRLLILGGMTEGGKDSEKYHIELEDVIRKVKPARVILCSAEMEPLWNIIKFDFAGEYYETVEELNKDIKNWIKDGDFIFIKSSHSIGLYKTALMLKSAIN